MPRRKVPPDVARLLAVYEQLGRAARWGQHVHERVMRRQLRDAARRARALEKRLRS